MKVLLFLCMLCFTGHIVLAQDVRPATDAEKLFVGKVEQRISQLMANTAASMSGNWKIKFDPNKAEQQSINIAEHAGKAHEYRCFFSMEYIATPTETKAMNIELAKYFESMAKKENAAEGKLHDPSLKYSIEVSAVINPYDFSPIDVQKAAAMGGTVDLPASVLTFFRSKELGTSAPSYSVYLGDYTLVNTNGKQMLEENHATTTICTDVRTMRIDIRSNPGVAELFLHKLDLAACNRIIQEL